MDANNFFQGTLHVWDLDQRKAADSFWKKEQECLLKELECEDEGSGRSPALKRSRDRSGGLER